MTAVSESTPIVVVGGWGVDAAMLEPVLGTWPGHVTYVSLSDELLRENDSIEGVAAALAQQHSQPAIWLGWSQGAQVAMAAASIAPAQVCEVITLAGFPRFVAGAEWPLGMPTETFAAFREGCKKSPARTWRRFQQLLTYGVGRAEAAQARRDLSAWVANGPVADESSLQRGLAWLEQEDQCALWATLDVPALHLHGENDALVEPWWESLALPHGASHQVISGMTHWPRGAAAQRCAQALHTFAFSREAV